MNFKLVRVDCLEPSKIRLPLGKHFIGRGKLLDCDDKRISRNHGELEVNSDTIVIKALHHNPCYIIKQGTKETEIIKQNNSINLSNGDKLGLLPDSFWYEVLQCAIDEQSNGFEAVPEQDIDTMSVSTEPFEKFNEDVNEGNSEIDFDLNDNECLNGPSSPSLLPEISPETKATPTKVKIENESSDITSDLETTKRSSDSPDPESVSEAKKMKMTVKEEADEEQDADTVKAGPSNNQEDNSNSDDKLPKDDAAKPANGDAGVPPAVGRERCIYGADCYRRNPAHKAQFSHPRDADWGEADRGHCPWGARCRRRDPRHWAAHSHPRPAGPPPRPGNKKRVNKKYSSEDDSEDNSVSPPLVVEGKRNRKPVLTNLVDSESDGEDEDPFQTAEDSDEWQPYGVEDM